MSSTAQNIKLYPEKAEKSSVRPYTKLDEARDLDPLYELPNALVKPALFLMSRRRLRQPGANWADVASKVKRSQPQVTEALNRLAALGLAECHNGLWYWKTSGKPAETQRKSYMAAPEIDVQDGEKEAYEYKEQKELKENTNNTCLGTEWPAQFPGGVDAGAALASNTNTPQTPVQAEPAHPQEGTINVTEKQKVAPAGAAPQTYRAAQDALTRAGAWDLWQTWVRGVPALARSRAAQDAQIVQFAAWVDEGFGDPLRENVKNIVEAGTFAHPYNALKARMEKLKAVQHAEKEKIVELRRAFGDAQCQPGERRRAPDGRVWTVEIVEYGVVFFAELGAPLDVTDREAAGWAVEA